MAIKRCLAERAKNLLPYDAWGSFDNTQYNPKSHEYLDDNHIESLRQNSEIITWETLREPEVIPGIGKLERIGFTTKKGYAYSALIGSPESPECVVPVIGTSAWTTSTEGHNERTVRNFMRSGNYVFFVGAEGSFEPEERPQPNESITLADSAAAVLNFSYYAAQELIQRGDIVDPSRRSIIGESRGAMTGMGIIALAEDFGQEAIVADFAAPCLPRKMKLSDIRKFIGQIGQEPIEIAKLGGKLTLARLIHYPGTIDLSPYSLRHQLAIGFALFSGEAGALAKHIDQDKLIHITVFDNDIASMRAEWEDIFSNHPNIRITPLPGSHMTIADLETLQFAIARNKASQLCISEDRPLTQESIFDAAHSIAPYQKPLHHAA